MAGNPWNDYDTDQRSSWKRFKDSNWQFPLIVAVVLLIGYLWRLWN